MSTAIEVKTRPILFSDPMVRAILSGRKTQTRRIVKLRDMPFPWRVEQDDTPFCEHTWPARRLGQHCRDCWQRLRCPYGQPGDRLWAREGLRRATWGDMDNAIQYTADDDYPWDWNTPAQWVWKRNRLPPMHCPRGLSRITLEITDVRVQRVQDITECDASAEGVDGCPVASWASWVVDGELRAGFADLWDRINGDGAWERNDWTWTITFKRVEA